MNTLLKDTKHKKHTMQIKPQSKNTCIIRTYAALVLKDLVLHFDKRSYKSGQQQGNENLRAIMAFE